VLWEAGKLKRCEEMCKKIIGQYGTGPAVEQAYVLLVKTEASMGAVKPAQENAAAFRKQFPDSLYASAMADAEMDILERQSRDGNSKTQKRLEELVETTPYGVRADRAQLLIGDIHLKKRRYMEARDAYDVVLKAYPQSRYRVQAEFGKAKATYLGNQGVMRDAGFYVEAEQLLKGVLEAEPDFALRVEAQKYLKEIHNRLGERQFRVGKYYEGQGHPASAGVYYVDVVKRFQDTSWSAKAQARLKKLGLAAPAAPETATPVTPEMPTPAVAPSEEPTPAVEAPEEKTPVETPPEEKAPAEPKAPAEGGNVESTR
jgi:outer membrane assembly lipoprotein YfiO